MKRNFNYRIFLMVLTLTTGVDLSADSYVKTNGSNAKVAGCLIYYASNDCSGNATRTVPDRPDGAAGEMVNWGYAAQRGQGAGNTALIHSRLRGPNTCGNDLYYMPWDCGRFCQAVGHNNGARAQANIACNGAMIASHYCNCQGGNQANIITQLVITTAPLNQAAGACGTVTVQAQNAAGVGVNAPLGFTVNTRSEATTSRFYTDAQCTTPAVRNIRIAQGQNSLTLYFKDTAVTNTGVLQLFVWGLEPANQAYTTTN